MIKRSLNILSQQRVDTDTLKSIESSGQGDFDDLINCLVTGGNTAYPSDYIIRGFTLNPSGIGAASSALSLIVDSAAVLHGTTSSTYYPSAGGTFLLVPQGTSPVILNSALYTNVTGTFAPSSTNYIGLDYVRAPDQATTATAHFFDPVKKQDFTKTVPLAQTLNFQIIISTSWTNNVLPIAQVVTNSDNTVASIEDMRPMLFRLGSGGKTTPNPYNTYSWPQGRTENPFISTSTSLNPFYGGDKGILNQKQWMDAVMSVLREIKGTPFWYTSGGNGGSVIKLREDTALTVVTGSGTISHDATTSGKMNWSQNIYLNVLSTPLIYTLSAYASGSSVTLTNGQVAYLSLVRGATVTPQLTFTFGSSTVTDPSSSGWIGSNLVAGDYVKADAFSDVYYYKVNTVSTNSFTLTANYGTISGSSATEPSGTFPCVYAIGIYSVGGSGARTLSIASSQGTVPFNEDTYWCFFRQDNGGATPKVYVKLVGVGLEKGESTQVSEDISLQTLQYIGAPNAVTALPSYSTATGSTITNNFLVDGNNLTLGAKTLDIRAGVQQTIVNQNSSMRLTNGGTWAFNSGTGVLSWSSNANISIPSLADSVNVIATGNVTLTAGQLAYVVVNRSGTGGTIAPVVVNIASYTQADNNVVFAIRDAGGAIYVGVNDSIIGGLATNVTGVVAIANGGTGQTTANAAFNALSPMTTGGDVIYGGASGAATRLANGSSGQFLKSNGGTAAPSWASMTSTYTAPTFQKFTSGSGTYTTPISPAPLYIRITAVGGGGGGGSGNAGAAGSNGGNTTFGTTLLVANGGNGGAGGASSATGSNGGTGGTASTGVGVTPISVLTGGGGSSGGGGAAANNSPGAPGGSNPRGGAGGGAGIGSAMATAIANTGGGGGGGTSGSSLAAGAGGGAGGFAQGIISSPAATYAYVIGTGGLAGVGGTNAGAGGSGVVIVEEFYQ